jgi:hypothetical protein
MAPFLIIKDAWERSGSPQTEAGQPVLAGPEPVFRQEFVAYYR